MTYIDDKRTIEEFLNNCQSKSTRSTYEMALKQFDHFCNEKYETTGKSILNELSKPDKNKRTDTSSDRIVSVTRQEKRVYSHSVNFTACKVGGITRKSL